MSGKKNQKKKQPAKQPSPAKESRSTIGLQKDFGDLFWLCAILLLTFIVFFPALNNALTNWDDPHYLTDNPLIRKLDGEHIKRIFTEVFFGNYQPLHIFSYAIEYH